MCIRDSIDTKDLEKLARSIADGLGTEFYSHVLVGIGTTVEGIKAVSYTHLGIFFYIENVLRISSCLPQQNLPSGQDEIKQLGP